jgi:hypothetical protein
MFEFALVALAFVIVNNLNRIELLSEIVANVTQINLSQLGTFNKFFL